jgi:hypothetical protein
VRSAENECVVRCHPDALQSPERQVGRLIYSIHLSDDEDGPKITWQNRPSGVIIGPYRHPLGLYEYTGVGTGIPLEPETPILEINMVGSANPLPDVLPATGGRWYISRRAKEVFESLDAGAFDFRRAQTRLLTASGEHVEGPEHYVCDVVRFIDALDEQRSPVTVRSRGAVRVVSMFGDQNTFRVAQVDGHSVFRPMYSTSHILCTDDFCSAVQRASLTYFRFERKGLIDT